MKIPDNIGDLLGQFQELQGKMSEAQSELESREVEASAGGGMVSVRVNGAFKVLSVKIEPAVVDAKDVEMLQDLVAAATNEALRKAKDMMKEQMTSLTGGIPIPGL